MAFPDFYRAPRPAVEEVELLPPGRARWYPGRSGADPTGPDQLAWLRRRPAVAEEAIEEGRSPTGWRPGYSSADPTGADRLPWRRHAAAIPAEDAEAFAPRSRFGAWESPPVDPLTWRKTARPAESLEADQPVFRRLLPWYLPGPAYGESLVWLRRKRPAAEDEADGPARRPHDELWTLPAIDPLVWRKRSRPDADEADQGPAPLQQRWQALFANAPVFGFFVWRRAVRPVEADDQVQAFMPRWNPGITGGSFTAIPTPWRVQAGQIYTGLIAGQIL